MARGIRRTEIHHIMPKDETRWLQSILWPQQCLRVELVVHQEPGVDRWCYALEVVDPHTQELLAKAVSPAERYPPGTTVAAEVAARLREILLLLTDPEPF